jgi:hypothetical protein
MSLRTLQKKGLKIVFASLIASMLMAMLAVTSAHNLSGTMDITSPPKLKLDDALLQKMRVVGFPGLGALAAVATLLVPFGLSTLRIWRKDRSP